MTGWMTRLGALAFAALLPLPVRAEGAVRVTERTAHSITLELATPPEALQALRPFGPVQVRGWARTTRVGWPELPLTGTLVAIPAAGEVRLEVLEERHALYPEARPGLVAPRGAEGLAHPEEPGEQPEGRYPAEAAVLSERLTVLGESKARVLFHPFRFDPATRTLEASSLIRVRVVFDEPLGTPAAAPAGRTLVLPAGGHVAVATLQPAAASLPAEAAAPSNPRQPVGLDLAQHRLRLEVTQTGLYHVPYETLPLLAMGCPVLEPGQLRLTCQGQDVPLNVVCANGAVLESGDYLEFYGQALDTIYSTTNVYSLDWQSRPQTRLHARDGATTAPPTVTSFMELQHVEQNTTFLSTTPGAPAVDFWFWERLTAPMQLAFTVQVAAVDPVPGTLVAYFQGITTSGHHTQVLLNGTLLGDTTWSGVGACTMTSAVPAGLLVPGANTLVLNCPGDTGATVDQIWLDYYEVAWSHPITAAGDRVTFAVPGSGPVVVQAGGFSSPELRLLDVTEPMAPVAVQNATVTGSGGTYQLTFQDAFTGTRTYYAATAAASLKPAAVSVWPATGIKRSQLNGADYLLITSRAFLPAAQPLLDARKAQGLRAVGVAMEDIYGEFSNGLTDPQALQDFLTYAYQHWTPPAPQYVLLLGDASFDYLDYKGTGKQNIVPVHFTFMADLGLTPDDNWYVTLGQPSGLPAMMLGRLSAANPAAVTDQVQKILAYEQSTTPASALGLFVADDQDPTFETNSNAVAALLPATMQVQKLYVSAYEGVAGAIPAAVDAGIQSALDGGVATVSYFGHGNTGFWTRDIFQTSDVAALTNATCLPFFISFDCLTGYFADPEYYSLGETLVAAQGKGAIAVFASSGLGYNWEHELLGQALFGRMFQQNQTVLGVLATQSKLDAYAQGVTTDTVSMFNLLGDPAMKLKPHP